MTAIKIHTASPEDLSPPVQSESFCVDLVLASDYQALEARCAALAAENAGLKSAKEIIRHLNANREEANFCGIDDCYIDDAVAAMITPATDVFLAEVRAQGVEMAIEHMQKIFGSKGEDGDQLRALEWLAQAIRKGGAA
ncbi:hypothetical protein CG651_000471 [Salmonella enterica]|nr:hypothetical protein [Salmonella enterica]